MTKIAFYAVLLASLQGLCAFDREATLQWFREQQFGATPVGRPEDETLDERGVSFFGGQVRIDIECVLPDGASCAKKVPVFLYGDNACASAPASEIASRGYALVRWDLNAVAPDVTRSSGDLWRWPRGVVAALATGDPNATNVSRKATSWGTIGVWAWGHSRVMDWIETRPELDSSRVAVIGSGRGAKAALWAGAQDTRFAMVVSSGSGCGGAKLARLGLREAEDFGRIVRDFPNGFCPAFSKWAGHDVDVPHDADDLLRLVAPRLLYVSCAEDDVLSGSVAEVAAWDSAHDAWQAVGLEENMGCHVRRGGRGLKSEDWQKFMDFSDLRMKRRVSAGLSVAARTEMWQNRIDEASAHGGGTVRVPRGRHLVGELELRSNVRLHLEEGAVLEGAVGIPNYRARMLPFSEGTWSAVVSAVGVTNVAVTGAGEVFGNGKAWSPGKNARDAMGCREGVRPRGLFFADCSGVRLEDFTLRDAACWGVVFKRCDGVVVRNVKIDSCVNHNNDGFDIEARNVLVERCDVRCGDDALCVKSNDPGFCVENVVVRDTVVRTHCNAIKLGTASHGTMRRIRFKNIRALAPDRVYRDYAPSPADMSSFRPVEGSPDYLAMPIGISAIAVECVDGGTVEDVVVDGVEVDGYRVPIFVRGGMRTNRACAIPPGRAHILRDVVIQNVRGRAASTIPSSISGATGCRPRNVLLRNVDIECVGSGEDVGPFRLPGPELDKSYPEATLFKRYVLPVYGLYIWQADDVRLEDVNFTLREGTSDSRSPY